MRRSAPHPWVFAVLYFPMGLMIGYPSVALGYLGSRAGVPVSATAAIVGMSFLAHAFKFIWAPLGDYSLSRRTWYLLAAATKINLFFAMNTLFSLGVLRLEGFVHDRWTTNAMLLTEAALGVAALALFVSVSSRIPGADRAH